jgi:hypothetical protein
MRHGRTISARLTLVAMVLSLCGVAPVGATTNPKASTVALAMPSAYTPHAKAGSTDDYHCTLMDPRVQRDAFVTSSQFIPGSKEVHHAALFLVPPKLAAAARRANVGGRGWTCFGEASLPGVPFATILKDPMLSEWAPGHGADDLPVGTGVYLPKGSLVIMQVHYNLLVGHRPVRNRLVLHTVPATAGLEKLKLNIVLSPPDIPCPAGVTGPLCDRSASLANQGERFGEHAVTIVNSIEAACRRDPVNPPSGDTTSCTWPVSSDGYIVRTQAHMHLLGRSLQLTLNPGAPDQRTVLDVPAYNFDFQRAYNLRHPIAVRAGDTLQVSCTYDPTLAQKLPMLRTTPSHFVTWGDGSTDEMCIGLAYVAPGRPQGQSKS